MVCGVGFENSRKLPYPPEPFIMSLFKRLFATKSIEMLHKEMAEDEGRLRRVLGPVGLTSLGVGAIIGAGIFVMTGRVAANDSGPAIMLAYVVAAVGCALAALCYAEFASMAPVAGSAYTYAYATLGELLAWIIGWDLILEYAMSAATVSSVWANYFNELTTVLFNWKVPDRWCNDPISVNGAYMNLPAVLILIAVTVILVIGIRESAASNTILVLVKLGVVLFVIAIGAGYVSSAFWTDVPAEARKQAEEFLLPDIVGEHVKKQEKLEGDAQASRSTALTRKSLDQFRYSHLVATKAKLAAENRLSANEAKQMDENIVNFEKRRPKADDPDSALLATLIDQAKAKATTEGPKMASKKWGLLGTLGLDKALGSVDNSTRSNFMPYGISGVMLGAALVFFAFIGFDSISTHSEEAIKPQRDVPIGIIASLIVCTILYIAVSAVISGMKPYPTIDTKAAVASAFRERGEVEGGNTLLKISAGLIAAGGLAGMTSVLLITFLSQARVFLAMARDGFLPKGIFGTVHPKFKTPHISTMITGAIMAVVAAFTPIYVLEEMVNIGTLFAFVVVCGAVLLLRIKRPDAHRPFKTPGVYIVAPLGIIVNVTMMMFLPTETWMRLVVWLGIGLIIYFAYGYWNSSLRKQLMGAKA
jgi:APA family basic amino acid/polyamine antiporter